MKENVKKQMRLQVIIGMVVIAALIISGDVVESSGYWMKGAAMVLGASAFGLFRRWSKRSMLPRLEDL